MGVLPIGVLPTGVFLIGEVPAGAPPTGFVPTGAIAIGAPVAGLIGVRVVEGPATGLTAGEIAAAGAVTDGFTVGAIAGVTGFGIATGAFSAASTPVFNTHASTQIEVNAAFFMS